MANQKKGKLQRNSPSSKNYKSGNRHAHNKLKRILRSSGREEAERWACAFKAELILHSLLKNKEKMQKIELVR